MRRQIFVGEVPEYTVIDGIVHAVIGEEEWCFPLRAFRMALAKAQRTLAEHDARCATVTPIKRRGRDHAASS